MKKINLITRMSFLIIVAGSLAFSSCSKSKDKDGSGAQGDYYLRFKLNGTQKEFNMAFGTIDEQTSGIYGSSINGANTADPSTVFNITLFDKTALQNGSYTQAMIPGTFHTMGQLNFVMNGNSYSSISLVLNPAAVADIKITEITPVYVKGTFSGKLYDATGTYTTVVYTITDGEFKAKRN